MNDKQEPPSGEELKRALMAASNMLKERERGMKKIADPVGVFVVVLIVAGIALIVAGLLWGCSNKHELLPPYEPLLPSPWAPWLDATNAPPTNAAETGIEREMTVPDRTVGKLDPVLEVRPGGHMVSSPSPPGPPAAC